MPAMTAAFAFDAPRADLRRDAAAQRRSCASAAPIGTAVLAVVLARRAGERPHVRAARPAPSASAYWWGLGIAVLSLIPCVMLLRAERPPRHRARRPPTPRPLRRRGARRAGRSGSDGALGEPSATVTARGAAARAGRARRGVPRSSRSLRRLRGRDTHLAGNELSHAQFELLIELHERGELSVGELAEAAQVTPATVTQMLDHLVACGHVERTRSEHDRRVVVSPLTAPWPARDRQAQATEKVRWESALQDLSHDQLRAATEVLRAFALRSRTTARGSRPACRSGFALRWRARWLCSERRRGPVRAFRAQTSAIVRHPPERAGAVVRTLSPQANSEIWRPRAR